MFSNAIHVVVGKTTSTKKKLPQLSIHKTMMHEVSACRCYPLLPLTPYSTSPSTYITPPYRNLWPPFFVMFIRSDGYGIHIQFTGHFGLVLSWVWLCLHRDFILYPLTFTPYPLPPTLYPLPPTLYPLPSTLYNLPSAPYPLPSILTCSLYLLSLTKILHPTYHITLYHIKQYHTTSSYSTWCTVQSLKISEERMESRRESVFK